MAHKLLLNTLLVHWALSKLTWALPRILLSRLKFMHNHSPLILEHNLGSNLEVIVRLVIRLEWSIKYKSFWREEFWEESVLRDTFRHSDGSHWSKVTQGRSLQTDTVGILRIKREMRLGIERVRKIREKFLIVLN